MLYKLDLGINHVLVDEAQDTSPKQWEIIRPWLQNSCLAAHADNVRRTLFAVGDEKQSIFSFQGAVPQKFAEMREHFRALHKTSDVPFTTEKLDYSFRSAIGVLDAVDAVFKQPTAFRGLTADPTWTVHQPLPDALPGEVEIWDLIGPDEKEPGKEGWDAPFDTTSETSPSVKLAAKIARTVKGWIARGHAARRSADTGASARTDVRSGDPRAQAGADRCRRRRPTGADRTHCDHGPAGARRRLAAPG